MASTTLNFYGQFTAASAGAEGLSDVTPELWQVTRANPPVATTVSLSGVTVTEIANGGYCFGVTGLDPRTYDYFATLTTADGTVDQQTVPAVWSEFSPSAAKGLPDATPNTSGGVPTVETEMNVNPAATFQAYLGIGSNQIDPGDNSTNDFALVDVPPFLQLERLYWNFDLNAPNAGFASWGYWYNDSGTPRLHLETPLPAGSAGSLVRSVRSAETVTVKANNDKTGYGLSSSERTTLASAVWNALTSALTTAGSVGKWIVDKLDVVVSTRLAASSYTAPDNASASAAASSAASAASSSATAATNTGTLLTRVGTPAGASVAADVAAVKSDTGGLVTSLAALVAKFTGITVLANWLKAMLRKSAPDATAATEIGGTYDATTDSQEAIRDRGDAAWVTGSGGGGTGSTTITLTPLLIQANNPRFSTKDLPPIPAGSAPADGFIVVDATQAAIDLSGKTVRLVAYVDSEGVADNPFDDTVAGVFKYETGGSGITVGGADNNQVTVQHAASNTATVRDLRYMLWNVTDKLVLAKGKLPIVPAVFDV